MKRAENNTLSSKDELELDGSSSTLTALTSSTLQEEMKTCRTITPKDLTPEKQIRFGVIEIHEHAIIMGTASIPSSGAPVTIDWERQAHHIFQVDDYEACKPQPRNRSQMLFSSCQRREMLSDMGYSMGSINREAIGCNEIRKQREASAKQSRFRFRFLVRRIQYSIAKGSKSNDVA